MFERLKRLYNEGKLNAQGVENAVTKGWITREQADEILAEPETEASEVLAEE